MTEQNLLVRTVTGNVTSIKMNKTITVQIERQVKHPVYGKYIKRSKKIHVHDEDSIAKLGDIITAKQCRPISKTKTWLLDQVIKSES